MPPTLVSLVFTGGTPAYRVHGHIPTDMPKVFGATYLRRQDTWLLPAIRPVHRKSLRDLEAAALREKGQVLLSKEVRTHLEALDAFEELPEDFEFLTQPFAHQREGLRWLYNLPRSGLFYDPGLGKCKITVDLYRLTKIPQLILCPAVVLRTWQREFMTHGGIDDVIVYEGTKKAKGKKLELAQERAPAAFVMTYESATSITEELCKIGYGALILDESHRIKEITSLRTKGALILSEGRPRRHLLSGTPTLGNPFSLYAQLKLLGNFFAPEGWPAFRQRYGVLAPHNEHQVVGYQNLSHLNARVNQVCVRKRQEECLDLPGLHVIDVPFSLSGEQKDYYNMLVERRGDAQGRAEAFAAQHNVLTQQDGPERPTAYVHAPETVSLLNKLEQVSGGFVNLTRSNLGICNGCPALDSCIENGVRPYTPRCAVAKAPLLDQLRFKHNARKEACKDLLVDILANPENKVIVWTRYLQELDIVCRLAEELGVEHVAVRGGMTTDAFEAAMHRFNTDPDCRIYAGQVASGIGVTLNVANYTIYYSLPWSHEHYVQSAARNYRIGQKRKVTQYRLLGLHTTDQFKAEALDQKLDVEDMLTNADFTFYCPAHSPAAGQPRMAGATCTCSGLVSRIVAMVKPIP